MPLHLFWKKYRAPSVFSLKNPTTISVIMIVMAFVVLSGCTMDARIGEDQAVLTALNDPAVHPYISNQSYAVRGVSIASFSQGSEPPVEMYAITIDLLDGSNQRFVVFVSYQGSVVSVDTSYPPPKPAPDLITASLNASRLGTGINPQTGGPGFAMETSSQERV